MFLVCSFICIVLLCLFFLVTLPLGFNCGFISTFACGLFTGVCSWGCPEGLGCAPVRARCGGGAAAWVTGVVAAPGTQGSWQLGQQEIYCSRRVWQQYWPICSSVLAWRNPLPDRSLAGHSPQGHKELDTTKEILRAQMQDFFRLWLLYPLRVEREGGPAAWLAGTWTASATGVMSLSESFFDPLVAGDQKACLASLFP